MSMPDDRKESVSQILRGGTHLLSLINEVLDIARIEAGHLSLSMEPVLAQEIADLAVELVRPLATKRGIEIVVDKGAARDLVVLADRQRLSQILLNLLSNAVKYNREHGSVTVGFHHVGEGRARLTVTDTGAGIPEAKMQLLFQPFERLGAEQTAIEGTGPRPGVVARPGRSDGRFARRRQRDRSRLDVLDRAGEDRGGAAAAMPP